MLAVTTNEITEIGVQSAVSGGVITGGDSTAYLPIVELLLRDKFQLYQQHRLNLSSSILENSTLNIFSQFENPLDDNKKYLLTGYTLDLCSENFEGTFMEYDNSDTINLV